MNIQHADYTYPGTQTAGNGEVGPFIFLISRIVDVLLLAIFLWYLIPEQFILSVPLVGGSRPITFMLVAAYACFSVEVLLRRIRLSRWALMTLASSFGMALLGLAGFAVYFEWKVFGNDLLTFCALATGLIWARVRRRDLVLMYLRRGARIAVVFLSLTLGGLILGVIVPIYGSERLMTQSMFDATYASAALLPFLVITGNRDKINLPFGRLAFWVAGLCAILSAAVISATRSVAIEGIASLLVSVFSILKQPRFKVFAIVLLCASSIGAFEVLSARIGLLQERSSATSVDDEARYTEAQMLLRQLDSDRTVLATGWGFGSLFESPIVLEDYNLAAAPHIGALTFLAKGGIPAFFAFILVPLYVCVNGLLRAPCSSMDYAAAASLLVYFAIAAISGGWFTVCLFIYGVTISLVTVRKGPRMKRVVWTN